MSDDPGGALRPPSLPSDRYEGLEQIGSGAMGFVYRAWDREARRHVAIKTLLQPDPEDLFRLKHEFRSLARIAHPNLVRLYEMVAEGDRCFFSMELIEGGRNLLEHLAAADRPEGAVRDAFRQLAMGLQRLHDANQIHRDVKPTNVLVDTRGRVVLLDFGLVSGLESRLSQESQLGSFVGTLAYMSPEQVQGKTLSPAADWYSFGVMLYEALTARSPFESATPMDLVDRSRLRVAPPVSITLDCPSDLSDLAMSLLATAPEDRPGPAEILSVLAARAVRAEVGIPPLSPQRDATSFVGRDAELGKLAEAAAVMKRGEPVAVTIEGASGIGKSELVKRFLAELDADTLILCARCYPYEIVPFQALDEAVDELSRFLVLQSEERIEALMPRDTAAMRKVFPVLGRIPLSERRGAAPLAADPREVRRQAFLELRELLARVADRHPLVIWIDDLQWSEADSEPLLRELMRPPAAPPVLWLLSFRSEERRASPLLAVLDELLASLPATLGGALRLDALTDDESRELASRLAVEVGRPLDQIEAVAAESGGSPFLLGEMVRHYGVGTSIRGADFGAVLAARIAGLPDDAKLLLETVAVAAGPLERRVAVAASGPQGFDPDLIANLERERLLRTTTYEGQVALEVYHHRIREGLEARLTAENRCERHRVIARTLQGLGSENAHALYTHFHAAGETLPAAGYAVKAGDQAAAQLAFDQAATFYRRALDLDAAPIDRCELLTRLAEALANAGRGGESALVFEQAAEQASAGSSPQRAVTLRREAAEQHLLSGRLEDGMRILEPLLRSLGAGWPATTEAAMRGTLRQLPSLALRYRRFRQRSDLEIPDATRLATDVCQAAAKGLLVVDPIRAAYFSVRGLNTALRSGDLLRTGRALGAVGVALVPVGGPVTRWARHMLRRSASIGEETGDPYLRAIWRTCEAEACFVEGSWSRMLQLCDEGVGLLRTTCRGVRWEIDVGNMAALRALEELGRVPELQARLGPLLEEAEELDDRYASVTFRFYQAYWRIARGEAADARSMAREALGHWGRTGALHLQHLYALRIEAFCDLCGDRPEEAWERVRTTWPGIRKANLLRHPVLRSDAYMLRACTALALAEARAADPALLREAEQSARVLARAGRRDTRAGAALIRAGVALLRGQAPRAQELLDEAIGLYDEAEMPLHAAYARRRRGQGAAGEAAASAVAAADHEMRVRGIADPERWLHLVSPGFG